MNTLRYPGVIDPIVAEDLMLRDGSENGFIVHCHMLIALALQYSLYETMSVASRAYEHDADERSDLSVVHETDAQEDGHIAFIEKLCTYEEGQYSIGTDDNVFLLKFEPSKREECIKILVAQQWIWWHRKVSYGQTFNHTRRGIPTNRNRRPVTWQGDAPLGTSGNRHILWDMPFRKETYDKFMNNVFHPLFGHNTYLEWRQVPTYKRLLFVKGTVEEDGMVYQWVEEDASSSMIPYAENDKLFDSTLFQAISGFDVPWSTLAQ